MKLERLQEKDSFNEKENVFEKGFFVIGTDTGIGKTYVSSLLYKGLKEFGGGYYKPIQSGCFRKGNSLVAPDVEFVCSMAGVEYDEKMVTYTLEAEVSPHLASELENVEIEVEKVVEEWEKLKKRYRYMIVEGAGGLYVPLIRDKFYIFDLIKKLNLPVILVCSSRVGAINHSMLTIDKLKSFGIDIHGLIFNNVTDDFERDYFEKDNIEIVLKLSGIKNVLLVRKEQKDFSSEEIKSFFKLY